MFHSVKLILTERHSSPNVSSSSVDDDKVSLNATESSCEVEEKKNDNIPQEIVNPGIKISAPVSVNTSQNSPSSTPSSKVLNPKSVPISSGLSPSSSMGSLPLEKSTLNPYAKVRQLPLLYLYIFSFLSTFNFSTSIFCRSLN